MVLYLDRSKLDGWQFTLNKATWTIRLVPPSHRELNRQNVGMTVYHKTTIFIDSTVNDFTLSTTFWHEFFHAATMDNSGSKQDEDGTVDQEIAANMVGSAMIEILPQVLSLLKEPSVGQEASSKSAQPNPSASKTRSRANRNK